MSDFETWWQQEGQEFLYALNTTTDDDIKLVAEFAWKNCAYKVEQPVSQEPVKREHITDGSPCWCNPELNYKDPETGAEVLVHKEPQ